jgi:hypothetical protein
MVKAFPEGFLAGDRGWGNIRLLTVIVTVILFMLMGCFAFEMGYLTTVVDSWRSYSPILSIVPEPLLYIPACFLTLRGLRYLIAPLTALVFVIILGARYVRDIYELPDLKFAVRYLLALLFSFRYPHLTIADGRKVLKPGQLNLLDGIGGPGSIRIMPGNVVIFEKLKGPSNVRAAGGHFIPRMETIKEIASLDDQHGYIEAIPSTTKDGIEVLVQDVHFSYRLRTGRQSGDYTERTPIDPYPFSVQAVRNMAYNRTVRDGELVSWNESITGVVSGVIANYINRHQVDHLTAPPIRDQNPRNEIDLLLQSKGTREQLRYLGADLLWCDIGHFAIPEEVNAQRVNTWQAKWKGEAAVVRADSEARRISLQEQGRAEAQAELLMSIVRLLEDMKLSGDIKNVRRLFLARTAQILEAMTDRHTLFMGELPPPESETDQ